MTASQNYETIVIVNDSESNNGVAKIKTATETFGGTIELGNKIDNKVNVTVHFTDRLKAYEFIEHMTSEHAWLCDAPQSHDVGENWFVELGMVEEWPMAV